MVARLSSRARTIPRRSPFTNVTPALCIATSVPVPMAMPTWALRQRRSIVDPVTGHGDEASLLLKPLDLVALVLWQYFGDYVIDTQLARHCRSRRAAVSREHDDPDVFLMQLLDSFGRSLLDGIGHTNQSCCFSLNRDEHHRLAVSSSGFGGLYERFHVDLRVLHEFAIAEKDRYTFDASLDP